MTMCGIVACTGLNAGDLAMNGLRRLQYRGYDSFGLSWVDPGGTGLQQCRSTDSLDDYQVRLPHTQTVIGHTRWATHGPVTLENCHPHQDDRGRFSVVHNGIVENHQYLRSLHDPAVYRSGTDTEVIVHLLTAALDECDARRTALRTVLHQLSGRNTVVVLFADGEILGVKEGSPLVIGTSTGQSFLGSDVLSFSDVTRTCCALAEGQMVSISGAQINVFDVNDSPVEIQWSEASMPAEEVGKDGHEHFMIKEILEQWLTVARQATIPIGQLAPLEDALRNSTTIMVLGAGGAFFASEQIAWLLREKGFAALAVPAYEIESVKSCFKPGDVVLAISQSGETADTLRAIEVTSSWGMQTAALVNMPMSTLAREAKFSFPNNSGAEMCVLSTKSASAQVTFGYLLASLLDGQNNMSNDIDAMSSSLAQYFCDETLRTFRRMAASLAQCDRMFVLGRKLFYGTARMAALNIKEASYIHAEAFAAGELKHGVIALIEQDTPVVIFVDVDDNYMLNVAAEVKARGARVIAIGYEDNALFSDFLPLPSVPAPLLAAVTSLIPGQLLAYYLGVARGLNPDKPRNLAKSVTVQ